jgi:hypothetical protein
MHLTGGEVLPTLFVVHYEIKHEFDAPLDAIELAVMSPDLGPMLGHHLGSLESVEALWHELCAREFRRVWRFQAKAPLKILKSYGIAREMMTWDEHATYCLDEHVAKWYVVPRGQTALDAPWRKHFRAAGSYHLEPISDGRTRRTVVGDLEVRLKGLGAIVERVAVLELRKAYDAEAEALRSLCALT